MFSEGYEGLRGYLLSHTSNRSRTLAALDFTQQKKRNPAASFQIPRSTEKIFPVHSPSPYLSAKRGNSGKDKRMMGIIINVTKMLSEGSDRAQIGLLFYTITGVAMHKIGENRLILLK